MGFPRFERRAQDPITRLESLSCEATGWARKPRSRPRSFITLSLGKEEGLTGQLESWNACSFRQEPS